MANISILGTGGFGCALAVTFNKYCHNVIMWSFKPQEIEAIKNDGENKKLLPGIKIDTKIALTTDITDCKDSDIIIVAVPSFAVSNIGKMLKDVVSVDTVIVDVAKGFDTESLERLSVVLQRELPNNKIVSLSGPTHAEEIARDVPTTIVAASECREAAEYVQDTLTNRRLRIYVSDDIMGVEIGGALKNIIALAAGMCDGLNLGDNTKAALLTRGMAEIARLGVAMGAKVETFAGLSGIGDLIVTCTSMHSRNRRAGILMGKGYSVDEAVKEIGMTVEGVTATKIAFKLSERYNITMPIVRELYNVMYENKDINQALKDLMGRPVRHENEEVWEFKQKNV